MVDVLDGGDGDEGLLIEEEDKQITKKQVVSHWISLRSR